MHLFYTPEIISDEYTLSPEESKHCSKVLRLKKDDTIFLTDGKGKMLEAIIISTDFNKCIVKIVDVKNDFKKRNYKINIAVAPTKNLARFEWFVEKATEMGIDEITPVICEHSEKFYLKPERINKIIESAMKQSLSAYHPLLHPPIKFADLIGNSGAYEKYIALCNLENTQHLKNSYTKNKDVLIVIGPEGDFSNEEIQKAFEKGFTAVSLGNSRLRTETAALVACQLIHLLNV